MSSRNHKSFSQTTDTFSIEMTNNNINMIRKYCSIYHTNTKYKSCDAIARKMCSNLTQDKA